MSNSFFKLFVLILSCFFVISCKGQKSTNCIDALNEKLSPKINEENKIGEIINIRDNVNCFEWDSLVVIMAIALNEKAEKDLGIKLPLENDYSWGSDSTAMLLFVKDKKVVHHILQESSVDKKTFDNSKSIKSYHFLDLLKNYGNDSYYTIIPKKKTIFETYPIIYHDENGKEIANPKYGLGIKVMEN